MMGGGENIVQFDYWKTVEFVVKFAEQNELDLLLNDGDAIQLWCDRWIENGWKDKDGRDMNQGVVYRDGTERRLLPRWASMLLGLERGYRRRAGMETSQ